MTLLNAIYELLDACFDAIKGTGFVKDTDSLKNIKDNLDEVKGTGFESTLDSLKVIKESISGIAGSGLIYAEHIPDVDVDETATGVEADCVLVNLEYTEDYTYALRHARVKCEDPGDGEKVTVRLYTYWDGGLRLMDYFEITSDNFDKYFSLMDMFGVPQVQSDAILVRALHSIPSGVGIKCTYRYATASTGVTAYINQIYAEQIPGDYESHDTPWTALDLSYLSGFAYVLRDIRIKSGDPGVGNKVTVKLYERWQNEVSPQLMDSFDITHDNYATYFSLMDMFGVPEVHSDAIKITVEDAAGVTIERFYRYAKAYKP